MLNLFFGVAMATTVEPATPREMLGGGGVALHVEVASVTHDLMPEDGFPITLVALTVLDEVFGTAEAPVLVLPGGPLADGTGSLTVPGTPGVDVGETLLVVVRINAEGRWTLSNFFRSIFRVGPDGELLDHRGSSVSAFTCDDHVTTSLPRPEHENPDFDDEPIATVPWVDDSGELPRVTFADALVTLAGCQVTP